MSSYKTIPFSDDWYDEYFECIPGNTKNTPIDPKPERDDICSYRWGNVQHQIGIFDMIGKDYRLSDKDIIKIAQRTFSEIPWCKAGRGRLELRIKNTTGDSYSIITKKEVELWCPHCYKEAMK